MFDLRERIFKKLVKKRIIRSDFDQSAIDDYEKNIAERIKLRKQAFDEIANEEQYINNNLFKEYFKYPSPSKMYDSLSDTKNTERHNIQVNLIKSSLIDLKKDIGNTSKDDVNKIEEMNKIADIVEHILEFNNDDQQKKKGHGLKILTPNQMLSRLLIALAQLNAGNNCEKLKNEIRQILYSLYRSKKLAKQIYKSLIDNI